MQKQISKDLNAANNAYVADTWVRIVDEGVKATCDPVVAASLVQAGLATAGKGGAVKVPGLPVSCAVAYLRRSGVSSVADTDATNITELRNTVSEVCTSTHCVLINSLLCAAG